MLLFHCGRPSASRCGVVRESRFLRSLGAIATAVTKVTAHGHRFIGFPD
jgi:hypothetical protein